MMMQRWLGLADLQIQTAAGSGAAEMTIEGLMEYREVRDYLYSRMRGTAAKKSAPGTSSASTQATDETVQLLERINGELRGAREALERVAGGQR